MGRIICILILALLAGNAFAGHACVDKPLSPADMRAGLALAQDLTDALNHSGAQVAIVARVGRDLSRYGLRYSHVGFAWRGHPRHQWTMVEELNQCGTANSALFDDGFGNFFLDDMFTYETKFVIPSPAVQRRIAAVLAAGGGGRMHDAHYNLVAYPFSTRYQNSNQWVLETLAEALADTPVRTRDEAQAWLQQHDYQPSVVHLSAIERLGGEMFSANVAFDDHPIDRRMAGDIDVVSAESVLDFVDKVDGGAIAQVIAEPGYRAEGAAGLRNRSSTAHRRPHALPPA